VLWRGLIDGLIPGFRSRGFVWFFFLFAVAWTVIAGATTGIRYLELKRMMASGTFQAVEGEVRNFKPMPYGGHAEESFDVAGASFRYSDFDLTGGGFNNTASHGGPIREGLPVRIAYSGNTILRLEVQRDALPAQAERQQAVKREAVQRKRSMEQTAPTLGFLCAALIITLMWNLDWQHFMRYGAPAGPPYSPTRVRIFRAFFLLSFVGVAASLVSTLSELDLGRRDYRADLVVFVLFVGFFLVVDGYQRWHLRRSSRR
jgi:hypothetical protein